MGQSKFPPGHSLYTPPPHKSGPGPKRVEGGPDAGTMWIDLCLVPESDPETASYALQSSYNEEWIRMLIKHLGVEICEVCLDPLCVGTGAPADPLTATHADGGCICSVCGMEFREHEQAKDIPGYDGGAFLTRLCNGELVKL